MTEVSEKSQEGGRNAMRRREQIRLASRLEEGGRHEEVEEPKLVGKPRGESEGGAHADLEKRKRSCVRLKKRCEGKRKNRKRRIGGKKEVRVRGGGGVNSCSSAAVAQRSAVQCRTELSEVP